MPETLLDLRKLTRVVRGHAASDGAGIRVTRVIGMHELDHIDPFLQLDELRSEANTDYVAGFPEHPHRGFDSVTYMVAGSMEQRDHTGRSSVLESGGVRWTTAGRGVVRSEMPHEERGLMWGFQLWVNLPSAQKLCVPQDRQFARQEIPTIDLPNRAGKARVIAGALNGTVGPVTGIAVEPLFFDVALAPLARAELDVPAGHNVCVYMFDGSARFGAAEERSNRALGRHDLGVLGPGATVGVEAARQGARFLLLAGAPLNEHVERYGPFVMNTREQLQQAIEDFRRGRFLPEERAVETQPEPVAQHAQSDPEHSEVTQQPETEERSERIERPDSGDARELAL
jgi:redox-sensitive bicupin YhaK (pirin superfamily)